MLVHLSKTVTGWLQQLHLMGWFIKSWPLLVDSCISLYLFCHQMKTYVYSTVVTYSLLDQWFTSDLLLFFVFFHSCWADVGCKHKIRIHKVEGILTFYPCSLKLPKEWNIFVKFLLIKIIIITINIFLKETYLQCGFISHPFYLFHDKIVQSYNLMPH